MKFWRTNNMKKNLSRLFKILKGKKYLLVISIVKQSMICYRLSFLGGMLGTLPLLLTIVGRSHGIFHFWLFRLFSTNRIVCGGLFLRYWHKHSWVIRFRGLWLVLCRFPRWTLPSFITHLFFYSGSFSAFCPVYSSHRFMITWQ